MNKVGEYLLGCYLNWQRTSGSRKTLGEFANYLDVKASLLSMWMSGDRSPGPKYVEKLYELLGPEIYDALDKPRPDPRLLYIQKNWDNLSEEGRKKIAEDAEKYLEE